MSHQADAFGAGTPLYVDQTNNRLGINQAAPAHPLHVGTDDLIVDASGNLLVGKTTTAFGTQGVRLSTVGSVLATSNGNAPAELNRLTSDGTLLGLYKDGTAVGSIGTASSRLSIGTSNVGAYFASGNILPWNTSTNATRDNAIDLGNASGRWKDLYLSSGVYLGGTGSANLLDDYEEGTWTPAYSTSGGSFTYDSATQGQYTKIGNMVTVYFRIYTTSATVGTGNVSITGLPFAEAFTNGTLGGSIGDCREFAGDTPSEMGVYNSTLIFWYRTSANGPNTRLQASDLGTGFIDNLIDGQITYVTS